MKNILLIGCKLLVISSMNYLIYAQTPTPPTIQTSAFMPSFPPNPESANLGKYGNLSVSHQTGLPQISIPIATLNHGKISTSLSLGYSAGGIKPSETASRVGLGWNLLAGGVITRTINGTNNAINGTDNIEGDVPLNMNTETSSNNRAFIESMVNSLGGNNPYDWEPDHYNYNVGQYSGNAFLSTMGDITPIKADAIKFSQDTLAVDFAGNKYYFELEEKTIGAFSISDNIENYRIPINAWTSKYLTKIVSFDNTDTIYFEYESYTSTSYRKASPITYTRAINFYWNAAANCSQTSYSGGYMEFTPNTLFRIKLIRSNSFRCSFVYGNNREDYPGDKFLSKIMITNNLNQCIQQVEFSYDYSASPSGCLYSSIFYNFPHRTQWLMLKSLKLGCSTFESDNKLYKFEYDPTQLPCRDTQYGLDVYGFSNGSDNVLFPNYGDDQFTSAASPDIMQLVYYGVNVPDCPVVVNPNNFSWNNNNTLPHVIDIDDVHPTNCTHKPAIMRAPNLAHTKAQSLIKMYYPTGGYSEFVYELNDETVGVDSLTKLTGGLRIKRIIDYDPVTNQAVSTKEYTYRSPNGKSSGYTMTKPVFSSLFTRSTYSPGIIGCSNNCIMISISTQAINSGSMAFADPFKTYYSTVTEKVYSLSSTDTLTTQYEYNSIFLGNSSTTKPTGYYHQMNQDNSTYFLDPSSFDRIKSRKIFLSSTNNNYKQLTNDSYFYVSSNQIPVESSRLGLKASKVFENICKQACTPCNRENYLGPVPSATCVPCITCPECLAGFHLPLEVDAARCHNQAGNCYDLQYLQLNTSNLFLDKHTTDWFDTYSQGSIQRGNSTTYTVNPINFQYNQFDEVSPTDTTRIKVLYSCDFSGSLFSTLKAKSIIDRPVEVIRLKRIDGSWYVVSGMLAIYDTRGYVTDIYRLSIKTPIVESSFVYSNQFANTITLHPSYHKVLGSMLYNNEGLLTQANDQYGKSIAYVWDSGTKQLNSIYENSLINDVVSLTFERNYIDNWLPYGTYSYSNLPDVYTGMKALRLTSAFSLKRSTQPGRWLLSFICKGSGDIIIKLGTNEIFRKSLSDKWTPIELQFNGSNENLEITKSDGVQFWDDILLIPSHSSHRSVSNMPMIGFSSMHNANRTVTRYTYDQTNRLTASFDSFGNTMLQVLYKYLNY